MRRIGQLALTSAFGAALAMAVLELPTAPGGLTGVVAAHMDRSGVEYAVTAVLLNFRGYDTWIEIGVFLVALLGVMALGRSFDMDLSGERTGVTPLLAWTAAILAPAAVIVAGYLLWQATAAPGGAFQAGAVLGAALVLLWLGGRPWPRWLHGWRLRLTVLGGFAAFLGVAVGTAATSGLLDYPPRWTGALILLMEAAVTAATALTLALLYFRGDPDGDRVRPAGAGRRSEH